MDLRRARSRKKLTDALGLLLEDKPLESITIEEITDKAGVSRPTFYSNFSDRQAIVVDHVRERLSELFSHFDTGRQGTDVSPVVHLANFYNYIFDSVTADDRLLRLALTGKAGDAALQEVKQAFYNLTKNHFQYKEPIPLSDEEIKFISLFYGSSLRGILEATFNGELNYDKGSLSMLMAQYVQSGKQGRFN